MASRDGTSDEEKEDGRGCLRVDPYWIRDFGVFSNVFFSSAPDSSQFDTEMIKNASLSLIFSNLCPESSQKCHEDMLKT